jgi:hypothetical protein
MFLPVQSEVVVFIWMLKEGLKKVVQNVKLTNKIFNENMNEVLSNTMGQISEKRI